MNPEIELSFPHRYSCEILTEQPGAPSGRWFRYPDDPVASHGGLLLGVNPERASAWSGAFAYGRHGEKALDRVLAMPDPDRICVVARGAGYVVVAAAPERWECVEGVFPILEARAAPAAGVVVFADHTSLAAYGSAGLKWRTGQLAWDGLSIISIDGERLVGEYLDIRTEALQEFEVDLATGSSRGGVE